MTKKRTFGILGALAVAAASIFALTQGKLTAEISAPPTETPIVSSPSVPQPCAYMWAYRDMPEISAELQAAVRAILPEAKARASAYGENCVAADGSATFTAMETDFYLRIPIADLNEKAALGNLIGRLLPIILDQFPRERLPGPKDGFVEFTFFLGENQRVVRAPIPLGRELREKGLTGVELLQALESP